MRQSVHIAGGDFGQKHGKWGTGGGSQFKYVIFQQILVEKNVFL